MELTERLKGLGINQATMCRDLRIASTTAMRWQSVPGYAVAYLFALELMDKRQRIEFQHKLALDKLDAEEK